MKASMILALGAAAIVSADYPAGNSTVPWTTSTVYATNVYTITSCAATVTDCPEKGSVTTEIVSLYTTYCPVEATEKPHPTGKPSGPYPTGPAGPSYPSHGPGGPESSPAGPHPTGYPSSPAGPVYPTTKPAPPVLSTITVSTCVPTVITSVVTVTPSAPATYVPHPSGGAGPSGVTPPPAHNTTIPPPFTGAASAQKAGGLLMAVGLVAALL